MPPYNAQVAALNKLIGAVIPRQTMKDCSGASVMDDKTQVTSVHGISVLDLAREPLEANFALPLAARDRRCQRSRVAGCRGRRRGQSGRRSGARRRRGGARGGQCSEQHHGCGGSIIGPERVERALACTDALIDLFAHSGLTDARDESFDLRKVQISAQTQALFLATEADQDVRPKLMIKAVRARGAKSCS